MEFTQANILLSISNHIEKHKHRISTYHIYSYNYLQTKLVILFHDCTQVIEYTENQDGDMEVNTGFTEDNNEEQSLGNVTYHKECYNKFKSI